MSWLHSQQSNFVFRQGKARQILFIEHKFYTTVVDPKCFTFENNWI